MEEQDKWFETIRQKEEVRRNDAEKHETLTRAIRKSGEECTAALALVDGMTDRLCVDLEDTSVRAKL